jgi:hypothetical protein
MSHAEFRRCLIDLDVLAIRKLWSHVAPGLPQPQTNDEALITLHHARTQAQSIRDRLRCYSHAWLCERGLPSGLPDRLKAKADRLYPRRVEAVGIAVQSLSAAGAERARAIERAMSTAVAECYADGERDPEIIKARMAAARREAEQ